MNFCRNNGQNNGIPAFPNSAKLPQPLNFSLFIAFLLTNFLAPNIFSEKNRKYFQTKQQKFWQILGQCCSGLQVRESIGNRVKALHTI